MTDKIMDQPEGSTPLEDISGLLRDDISTRGQLDEAESLNIVNAVEWLDRGRVPDVFTVEFYVELHLRMYDQVWAWAGTLRSETGARPNIGVAPEFVPMELGRVAMEYNREWTAREDDKLVPFIARYHHALVAVHPFDNGNGRWSRLCCDAVVEHLAKEPPIIWATDTLIRNSDERKAYIAALKLADAFDYQALTEYLIERSGDR
ncbi:MAG: mobile mystery protein B [Woeseiaceae bacterium]